MDDGSTDEHEHADDEHGSGRNDLKWAAFGGLAAAVIGFGGMAVAGSASSADAQRLLESVLPTVRFAASAYVSGGATVLALMLTLITFSISHDAEFRRTHYRRIKQTALLICGVIVASVLLLMFLSLPIDEADVDRAWYVPVYYAVLLGGAVTGGVFISAILMLFYSVRGLLQLAENDSDSELVVRPTEHDHSTDDDRERIPAEAA